MLRSIVSSIEFEKFRRNWSEKNSAQRFLWVALTQRLASIGARRDLMKEKILNLLIVEDNERLRKSLIEA
ncbi:hypothetical protein LEP1GSC186_3879 [Leptospira noguchii serovar Autumnalis str. ZUN142]|uniref:Uncharacterized protein n=1 Tax=Leptospira noguchii serovar Autumnalis str. ZUN142 TaxID=1085540 RepID=M6USN6_9LEPT|nr:hypothetical protein LEP1GSC186_3879 [Leptospira noguchii serovar Autumnalis str. ZUN142]